MDEDELARMREPPLWLDEDPPQDCRGRWSRTDLASSRTHSHAQTACDAAALPDLPQTACDAAALPDLPQTACDAAALPDLPQTACDAAALPDLPQTACDAAALPDLPQTACDAAALPDLPRSERSCLLPTTPPAGCISSELGPAYLARSASSPVKSRVIEKREPVPMSRLSWRRWLLALALMWVVKSAGNLWLGH